MSGGLFEQVLIAVDGSQSSRKAASYAIRLAVREGCRLEAVHVLDEENAEDLARYLDKPAEEILGRMRSGGERFVEEMRKLAGESGIHLGGQVRVGIPHREVLAAAAESGADLIVMGTVGRKGPRRVLIGSVTERVIEHSALPVLVVK